MKSFLNSKSERIDWTNPEEATAQKFLDNYNQMTGVGSGIMSYAAAGVGGPVLGLALKGVQKLELNNMINGLDAQIEAAKESGNTDKIPELQEIRNVIQGKNRDGTARTGSDIMDTVTDSDTYKGNSFGETLANLFTPNDGASYVKGQLVDDNTGAGISPGGRTDSGRVISGRANDETNDTTPTATSTNNDNDTHNTAMAAAKAAAKEKTEKAIKKHKTSAKKVGNKYSGSGK